MQGNVMQHEIRRFARRIVALSLLALTIAAPVSARDPARFDRNGEPRSERAQWVYRIVAKWGGHVQEAYRTDPRRWADSMGPAFARAPLPALRKAAEARSFAAMNDALLAASAPAAALAPTGGAKALGDPDRDLVYVPVTPCRILDTRIVGGPIPANSFRDFDLTDVVRFAPQGGDTSNCNVGDKGSFAAAALNITVVTPNMAGYITAFPYLASQPTAATINYVAGDIRNGLAIVRLDQTSAAYEFSVYSFAQTHLVADIVGYFREPEATALECVTVSSPAYSAAQYQTLDVNSPSCPAGYTIVSGSCDTSSNAGYMHSSITGETSHRCVSTDSWGPQVLTVRARCCRLAGR
jgi:hypothetical protein